MKFKTIVTTFILFIFSTTLFCQSIDNKMLWKVGIAKKIITPKTSVWLAGYGWKREPIGVIHDIWVKALAFEDQKGYRGVIVTSDLMGIPKKMYENIYQKVNKKLGIDRSQFMLTFSHNHSAPRLHENLVDYYPVDTTQVKIVKKYTEELEKKIFDTVVQAFENLIPATLSVGEGNVDFAVNRRNNVESEVPKLRDAGIPLKGPVDHSVPIMVVHNNNNELIAILFGYACHPTTLRFEEYCGDYPGYAQIELEKNHPGVTSLFFTGAGGDQNPIPRRKVSLCEQYGYRLAEAVEKVLTRQLKPIPSELRTAFNFVDIDYQKNPTREELEEIIKNSNDEDMTMRIHARWARRMLKKMDAGEKFATSYPYPVQVWKLGGTLTWIALGGEAVVDYSLRFKNEFGKKNTWVFGYVNTIVAYIPSERVYKEGGYEGGAFIYEYGHPAERWAGDIEERIVKTVHKLVNKVESNPIDLLGFKTKLEVILQHDEDDYIWFHPRPAAIPGSKKGSNPTVIITLQKHLTADDYYSGLNVMKTDNMGKSWIGPIAPPELDWIKESEQTTLSVNDVTPGWHANTKKLLAIGAQIRYNSEGIYNFDKKTYTAYAVYDTEKETWTKWKTLKIPPFEEYNSCRSACSQWIVKDDGTLLVPFYIYKNANDPSSIMVIQCSFDGEKMEYLRHGNILSYNIERGLAEPSLVKYKDKYYLTIRNDLKGYVSKSSDGLNFQPIKEWKFDDGLELGSYNTQQHWLTHSDGLFLVYTRRGANNDHINRHRAPLFIAQVDPDELCVIRKTERILIPEHGAPMGNFGASAISENESWVTVSEFMWPRWNEQARKLGAAGKTFVARVIWDKPNKLMQNK